ncbi:MAG: nucleotidyltransferase family protein [Anaerolineae bacterium]|nr:nucleotidyltransferase family protein [Anaerolineae bacterium]
MSDLVGLIPAAGAGTRVAPLPSSKELFPIGFRWRDVNGIRKLSPKAVSEYLVEALVRGGASRIFMIVNSSKADILRFYGDGSAHGVSMAYLVQEHPTGMPAALDLARPWLGDATVLFGMPDTIIEPPDCFALLLRHHRERRADLTLGLFATSEPWRFGMVELDARQRLVRCVDKPRASSLQYMWGIACWGSAFTSFLGEFCDRARAQNQGELLLGDAFTSAAQSGLTVTCHPFTEGSYLDVGSPDDLMAAAMRFCRHPDESS